MVVIYGYQMPWHDATDSYTGTKIVGLVLLFLYLRYYSASKVRMFYAKVSLRNILKIPSNYY